MKFCVEKSIWISVAERLRQNGMIADAQFVERSEQVIDVNGTLFYRREQKARAEASEWVWVKSIKIRVCSMMERIIITQAHFIWSMYN